MVAFRSNTTTAEKRRGCFELFLLCAILSVIGVFRTWIQKKGSEHVMLVSAKVGAPLWAIFLVVCLWEWSLPHTDDPNRDFLLQQYDMSPPVAPVELQIVLERDRRLYESNNIHVIGDFGNWRDLRRFSPAALGQTMAR